MKEEADWLAAARAAVPMKRQAVWGLDYEVGADRDLIRRLKLAKKPAAAQGAMARLEEASTASWAKYETTHNPQFVFSFAGDPNLIRDLRAAWPGADAQSALIMDTLEQTLAINALWVAKDGYGSNSSARQVHAREPVTILAVEAAARSAVHENGRVAPGARAQHD